MVNNPGNARLVVVFYSSPNYITEKSKVGMSGGNRIFLESIKRWKEKFNRIVTGTAISGTVEKFTAKPAPVKEPATTVESDNDDTLSYFAKLADED